MQVTGAMQTDRHSQLSKEAGENVKTGKATSRSTANVTPHNQGLPESVVLAQLPPSKQFLKAWGSQ